MLFTKLLILPASVLALLLATEAFAQRAPGEDPLKIEGKVSHLSLPAGPAAKPVGLDGTGELPAWLRAKAARFEAKIYSASVDDGSVFSDNDVNNTSTTQGVRRTCTQEVGSNTQANTAAGRATGAGTARTNANQQIVVLRGDLVNICR
jgi:hypothetical protein